MSKIMLQTAAPNLESSQSFYEKIGFIKTYQSDQLCVYSDTSMDLIVNGKVAARPGFVVYSSDANNLKDALIKFGPIFPYEGGFVTSDPNGIRVYLFPESCFPDLDKGRVHSNNMCGTNYGVGIETTRFDESLAFWQILGYEPSAALNPKSQYASLAKEEALSITFFMPGICPHAFYNPSLTYFNGKEGNPKVISQLRAAGIVPVEEITVFNEKGEVDNIIISDPGGLHSFIFNDG